MKHQSPQKPPITFVPIQQSPQGQDVQAILKEFFTLTQLSGEQVCRLSEQHRGPTLNADTLRGWRYRGTSPQISGRVAMQTMFEQTCISPELAQQWTSRFNQAQPKGATKPAPIASAKPSCHRAETPPPNRSTPNKTSSKRRARALSQPARYFARLSRTSPPKRYRRHAFFLSPRWRREWLLLLSILLQLLILLMLISRDVEIHINSIHGESSLSSPTSQP